MAGWPSALCPLQAPICSFWMFGLATFIEMPGAFREGKFALVGEHPQLFALSFALGFLVNVASFLVIKRTSSIMLKLMGTARNAGAARPKCPLLAAAHPLAQCHR